MVAEIDLAKLLSYVQNWKHFSEITEIGNLIRYRQKGLTDVNAFSIYHQFAGFAHTTCLVARCLIVSVLSIEFLLIIGCMLTGIFNPYTLHELSYYTMAFMVATVISAPILTALPWFSLYAIIAGARIAHMCDWWTNQVRLLQQQLRLFLSYLHVAFARIINLEPIIDLTKDCTDIDFSSGAKCRADQFWLRRILTCICVKVDTPLIPIS